MKVEVSRYRKADGYPTRYWAVILDGELLAVMLYRRGAEAVARVIETLATDSTGSHCEPENPSRSPERPEG